MATKKQAVDIDNFMDRLQQKYDGVYFGSYTPVSGQTMWDRVRLAHTKHMYEAVASELGSL